MLRWHFIGAKEDVMSSVTVNSPEDALHVPDKMDKYSFKIEFRQQIFGYFFSRRVKYGDYEFFLPDSIYGLRSGL
jgi:hypothetical protein